MNLPFISVVAGFLLGLAIAERNGPTNILMSRRRSEGRTTRLINDNRMNTKRQSRAFTLTGTRISQEKFPRLMTSNNAFIASTEYTKNPRSTVNKNSRNVYGRKINQSRRSLDLGIQPYQISAPKTISGDATFLEPIFQRTPEKHTFGNLFDKIFTPHSDDVLGPAIGPLNFPGIGRNVYIRLMVSPDKETSSRVTLHVVNKEPIEKFSDFVHPGEREPLFFPNKNPEWKTPASINPYNNKLATGPIPVLISNSQRGKFVPKSLDHFGPTQTRLEPLRFDSVQNAHEIFQQMSNNHPVPPMNPGFGQYPVAAPNHHKLPISDRPAENLIDLPIYPPLSLGGYKNEGNAKDVNISDVSIANNQESVGNIGDTQQSASSQQILISPNAQKAYRVSVRSEPEVTFNREESPAAIFMQEIKAPDLSGGNILSIVDPLPRRKSNITIISNNDGEYGTMKLQMRNSSAIRTPEEDKNDGVSNLDFGSTQIGFPHTTTSETNDESSHNDFQYSDLRSTTLRPSEIETSSTASSVKIRRPKNKNS